MRIDYDEEDRVSFIEFLGGMEGSVQPMINGKSVFKMNADELLELLVVMNNGDIDNSEAEYSYAFLNISVGIYRETTPDDVREMIEESKRAGEPMSRCDIDAELKKANHWATIGIGVKGYYE